MKTNEHGEAEGLMDGPVSQDEDAFDDSQLSRTRPPGLQHAQSITTGRVSSTDDELTRGKLTLLENGRRHGSDRFGGGIDL